jgi:hypothetical protein
MDDNDQPVNGQLESATQVVDFTIAPEELQTGGEAHETPPSVVQDPDYKANDLQGNLEVPATSETIGEGPPSDDQIAQRDTQEVASSISQGLGAQAPPPNEQETSKIPEIKEAISHSEYEVPPDEVSPDGRSKVAQEVVSPVDLGSQAAEEKTPSNPISASKEGGSAENSGPIAAPTLEKKLH